MGRTIIAQDSSGGTALLLVSALIADLQAKGLVSSRDLAASLAALGGRPGSVADRADLDHAIMILAGMTDSIDGA